MQTDAVHRRLRWILDNAQSGGFSPEEIDDALDVWSMKIFNDYLPVYGTSMDSREALDAFKVTADFETDSEGVFPIAGCERLNMCRPKVMVGENVYERDAVILNDDEVGGRLNSQLRPVDAMYPIIETTGKGTYKMYPEKEAGGRISYIARPTAPKFAYAGLDENDDPVYVSADSKHMEWSDRFVDRIILGAIVVLGVSLDNGWLRENGLAIESMMNKAKGK